MKKVLFTATVDSHILQFHLPFLKLFKNRGYEVHVATNGSAEIPYCDVKHVISFERSPFKINNLKAIKQLKKIINEEKFDIIHTHTPMGAAVTRLSARQARKKYKTRVIYTAHGFHFYKGAPLKNWIIFYPVEKWLSKYTDTLILINKEDYSIAEKKFSKRCKDIQYIPGVGIDEDKFNFDLSEDDKSNIREELKLNKDDFIIIYPAELNKNKNQLMIINAIEELSKKYNNIKVLLPGVDSYNGFYQELVKKKNLERYIKFLGYRKDIPKLLKIADLAVATSYREGLPLNVMEAMYAGLPIVATDCRGQRDLVKDNINGYLVDVNDQKSFLEYIEKIYLSKNEKEKFKSESQKIIKDYLLEEIIKELEKIYFRKKKIIHILASNRYSGAENVVCTIIDNMRDKYEMFYCSPVGTIKDNLAENNIKYIPIKKLSYFNIRKVINKIRPDVIHAHDNKATVIASFFYKKYKVISHIHGNNKIMNSINIKTILFNLCSKKIKKFIWVSDSSLNDYCFKNRILQKSTVLYNVIDKKKLLKRSNLYDCKESYDVIFLGRLGYPKNPTRAIEIFNDLVKKYNDIKIAIVGDGEERTEVENLIHKYRLESNITVFGFKSNPYPILKKSKILIMTSIYEGTPMCVLEAQAMGKPVIATPVDGLKKVITQGKNGYLFEKNDDFVKQIICLLNDEKLLNEISANAVSAFEKQNDLKNYLKTLDEIYYS